MSIIVKGMEMPEGCFLCILSFMYFNGTENVLRCNVLKKLVSDDGSKDPDCPLTEIPQHGRLIDADAINHEDEIWKNKCIPPQVVYNAWVVAGEMPTVIPADKDGET